MKIAITFLFSLICMSAVAQKFALIDESMARPITYTDQVTVSDRGMIPVEKERLPEFIKALEEISARLSAKQKMGNPKEYKIGCTRFTGTSINLLRGDRLDYVIQSDCGPTPVTMHLSNSKRSNTSNAYFINTWIKYIRSSL